MNIEVGEIYSFKMNSGEEVVATVVEKNTNSNELVVTNPVSVAPGPQGMGLVPSMFTVDTSNSIAINITSISMYSKTDETIKSKYIQATTGIAVPEKKLILG